MGIRGQGTFPVGMEMRQNPPEGVVQRRKPYSLWWQGRVPPGPKSASLQQGEHSRGHNRNGGGRWIEEETFNVYVDNLPKDTTKQWLWRVFYEVGRVRDIYLSHKVREKNPLKFAFVRFSTREEVLRAIEHFNRWIIWGCKLWLTESKFKRSGRPETLQSNKPIPQKPVENPIEKDKMENEVKGRRSYKDAVLNKEKVNENGVWNLDGEDGIQTIGNSKIYLEGDNELKSKLFRSLVVDTSEPYNLEEMKKTISGIWQGVETVKMVGPRKVLVGFESVKQRDNALMNHNL
ncbi:hypothetical protein PIB30_021607 [Stylosanthes scabra]|uniref:RRM domain-containing protein n=1 Tax=Stylosanthes scabra TaxID=79078 RepID=A0ABU6W902_9FABA|nr:hypothetical protein [Stylosanthes scabra]